VLVVQRVFRAKRTNLHEKYDYPVVQGSGAEGKVRAGPVQHLLHLGQHGGVPIGAGGGHRLQRGRAVAAFAAGELEIAHGGGGAEGRHAL
jgi:hypothetical protein